MSLKLQIRGLFGPAAIWIVGTVLTSACGAVHVPSPPVRVGQVNGSQSNSSVNSGTSDRSDGASGDQSSASGLTNDGLTADDLTVDGLVACGNVSCEEVLGQEGADTFSAGLNLLLQNSPVIAASREEAAAATASIDAAAAIPDLEVMYTYLPHPVETRSGANSHRVSISQGIPFPTKLSARVDVAQAKADRKVEAYHRAVRNQITAYKNAYAELFYYERALGVVTLNLEIGRALVQLGGDPDKIGLLRDVTRAQAQVAQLEYDEITLTERRDIALAELNALLWRASDAPIEVMDLPLFEMNLDETELYELALANQSELRDRGLDVAEREAELSVRNHDWAPNLMVGAMWMIHDAEPGTTQSGDDAVALSVGLSLPIWGWARSAQSEAAEHKLLAAQWQKEAHITDMQSTLRAKIFDARNAARLHALYVENLLPNAQAALLVAEEQVAQGNAGLADALEARSAYYSFSLASARAAADSFRALAALESFVGATLTTNTKAVQP